jgi:PAS domain S-box-containing protein
VFEASNGDLYLICFIQTLAILSPERKLVAVHTNSTLIVGMAEDAHGVVVSVGGELFRAGTNYFQPYAFTNAEKPPMYWILNLASGRDGAIWVASAGGIFRVKDGAYQQWSVAEGQVVPVHWICEDNEGVVWGGTLKGIVRLKDNRISIIDRQHGLFDDNIYSVIPDDLGNLWVDSNRGIFSVSRQSVNDFADGKTARVQCTVFDGMDSVKLSDKTTQERVACKTSDGRIWFPSANGVVMIDPAHIPTNQVAPQVHIDLVKADGREVARGEAVTVPPGKGELEFHFDASTYIAPQKARFRYQLQGYDNDWVDAGNRRMAFYTNLKPGAYTFQVIAANADGVWNRSGDSMNIQLLPHYYQTDWFYLLCGGLACGALAGLYAGRFRHLMHKQRTLQQARDRLESEVQKRTSELRDEIEERKQLEAELSREQDLWRTLLDNSPDHIYFKDAQSRFIKSSKSMTRLFGVESPDELLGQTDFDFFSDEHARPAFEDEQEIIRNGRPMIDKEEREVWKDGHVTWASSTKMPLRAAAGKIIGIMGISRDITERKRLEDHLIQSQKLETVGKLAGGIAHEFNSILTAIIGHAELLREDLPAGSPLAQNATAISQSADRAAILTRQLLAYGRKQFLRPEALNLNQVITGMSGVLNHLMGGDTVAVSIVPAAGLKPVKADAGQIEQVIMNLAMNARDAMPGGGKLTLETANVTFGPDDLGRHPELKPGGYVMLAISDTGRGMSEGVKARAFEPFFTTKDVGQGTGLGLSTCYGIVKQSGGHINVYSEPGRGTTFKIYLPQLASLPPVPLERLESPELPRGTETILLVEDDPALREMAATLLRRLGYTVLAAANGVEALSLKQQNDTGHVDLLLTDVVMPHMSGRELADRVRALFPQTRILFTSAYTENAIADQGGLDKGVALLQKPFTPSALARKVREMLDDGAAPKQDSQTQVLEK